MRIQQIKAVRYRKAEGKAQAVEAEQLDAVQHVVEVAGQRRGANRQAIHHCIAIVKAALLGNNIRTPSCMFILRPSISEHSHPNQLQAFKAKGRPLVPISCVPWRLTAWLATAAASVNALAIASAVVVSGGRALSTTMVQFLPFIETLCGNRLSDVLLTKKPIIPL